MGACGDNVRTILDDLKSSWYFRIWAFLWFVLVVVAFAALIMIGMKSERNIKHEEFSMWIENASSIDFPSFHIRVHTPLGRERGEQNFTSVVCDHAQFPLSTTACKDYHGDIIPKAYCFAIQGTGVTAINKWGSHDTDFIRCRINSTVVRERENTLLAFELEDENAARFSGDQYPQLWIGPSAEAWVELEKNVIRTREGKDFVDWQRKVVYLSNSRPNASDIVEYHIITTIPSFRVNHVELRDPEIGWMAAGEVGGFAFLGVIIHTIVMMLVGICLDNDSRFLRSGSSGHQPL